VKRPAPLPDLNCLAPLPRSNRLAPLPKLKRPAPLPGLNWLAPLPKLKRPAPLPGLNRLAPLPRSNRLAPLPGLNWLAPLPGLNWLAPLPGSNRLAPLPELKRPAPLPAVVGAVALLLFFVVAGPISSVAAVELGTLTIQSQPDVEVIWDGVLLGVTNPSGRMVISNIPPGTFALTFSSPGYTSRNESVDIAPGRQRLDALLAEVAPPPIEAPEPEPPIESAEPGQPIEAAGPVPAGEGGGDPQDHIATFAFFAFLAVLVLTAFLLADRRARRLRIAAKPEGPHIVVRGTSREKKRLPTFYDDLKRRETDLEELVDVGSGRSQRRVIEVQVEDHGPVEDD